MPVFVFSSLSSSVGVVACSSFALLVPLGAGVTAGVVAAVVVGGAVVVAVVLVCCVCDFFSFFFGFAAVAVGGSACTAAVSCFCGGSIGSAV